MSGGRTNGRRQSVPRGSSTAPPTPSATPMPPVGLFWRAPAVGEGDRDLDGARNPSNQLMPRLRLGHLWATPRSYFQSGRRDLNSGPLVPQTYRRGGGRYGEVAASGFATRFVHDCDISPLSSKALLSGVCARCARQRPVGRVGFEPMARPPVLPSPARDCATCGWTNYPQSVPIAPRSMVVTWTVPATCARCGNSSASSAAASRARTSAAFGRS